MRGLGLYPQGQLLQIAILHAQIANGASPDAKALALLKPIHKDFA
jgi:hypothetical protein